ADGTGAPVTERPGRRRRRGRWIPRRVGVEPPGDCGVAEPLLHPPCEDLRYHRVRHPFGEIAVGRGADVEALAGVLFEPGPRLLQHVQHVPFGDADRQLVGELADRPRPFGQTRDDGAPGGISQRVPTITGMVTTLCAVADRPASIMKVAVRNDLDCDVRMGPHGLVPSYLYRYPEAAAGQADR